jgi:hypothetical protein
MKASSTWFSLLTAFPLLVACSSSSGDLYEGGQTGDEGTSNGGPGCDYVPTVIDLDEETPLGFTAQEVLDVALGSHSAPFFWKQGEHEYGPESGESEMGLEIAEPGEARFMKGTPKPTQLGIGALCPDRVEVDVSVRVTTAGGALDESFVGPLSATSPKVAVVAHSFDVDELDGSFAFDAESLGAASVIGFRLNAMVTEFGLSGSLDATYELKSSSVVAAYGDSIGLFPAETACRTGAVAIPLEAGPLSSAAALELVSGVEGIVLQKPGESLAATLAIAHDGTPSCAELLPFAGLEPTGVVSTGAVLHLTTSDGEFDQEFSVLLESVPDEDGSLDHVRITGRCETKDAAEFSATCGDYGFELTGYDGALAALEITVRPGDDAPEVSGSISVKGTIRPDCVDNPPPCTANGCPGCPGVTTENVGELPIE